MKSLPSIACLTVAGLTVRAATELHVPGFTAYLDPVQGTARVSQRSGVTRWTDPAQKVLWFGEIKTPGRLECSLVLRSPASAAKFRLTVASTSREATLGASETNQTILHFGDFDISKPGYHSFTLESLNAAGQTIGEVVALLLDGPAAENAHFNLEPRRNAASVHLNYPVSPNANIEAFYCEVTAVEDPVWTFYMACGWHRGYFGMQVNSATERRIIFSVWDSGNEAVSRSKVAEENRVSLVAKGEGVDAGDFGNEGTGGHSHWVYPWKTGEKQRFVVTAKPTDTTHTIYSGFYFHPQKREWMLISSWRAPKDGGYLRRLHSFSENFGAENGHLRRKALFGNQWLRTPAGEWIELTKSTFSHDPTGRTDRLDRFMGVENGQFYLSDGGFVEGFTRYGEPFNRAALGVVPEIKLPTLPEKVN